MDADAQDKRCDYIPDILTRGYQSLSKRFDDKPFSPAPLWGVVVWVLVGLGTGADQESGVLDKILIDTEHN